MRFVLTIVLAGAGCSPTDESALPPPPDPSHVSALEPGLQGLHAFGYTVQSTTFRSRAGRTTNRVSIAGEEWSVRCTAFRVANPDGQARFDVFVSKAGASVEEHIVSTTTGTETVRLANGPGDFELRVVASGVGWVIEVDDYSAVYDPDPRERTR